jgi:hypothetical protein
MEEQYFLCLLEVGGIQDFIFSSNNLQVNIGASSLIRSVTDKWVKSLLNNRNTNFVNRNLNSIELSTKKCIEKNNLDVEIIYVGGGNALMLFSNLAHIEEFTKELTLKALIEAPGLHLSIAHLPFVLDTDNFKIQYSELRKRINSRKAEYVPPPLIMGLGVSTRCSFSGKPAAMVWKDPGGNPRLISREVAAKLCMFSQGKQYLDQITEGIQKAQDYEFISSFDDFGDKGISSYIAIVHADGNRMGERIKALGENLSFPQDNREYIQLLRNFSKSSKEAAQKALSHTLEKLLICIQTENGEQIIRRRHDVKPEHYQSLPKVHIRHNKLPFRPIVFGGDDVTFICDGRLGLAMAKEYLENYNKQYLAEGFDQPQPAIGRAGIAITPSHYPFSRGYELAEELASSAKSIGDNGKFQSLDWHFGTNGIVEPLKAIRSRSYRVNEKDITKRPVRLFDSSAYNFCTFEYIVKEFQVGDAWAKRRNKFKALFAKLRNGGDEVIAFRSNARLPDLPCNNQLESLDVDISKKGWAGSECYYFDTLEAMDFYVPLEF